jgi:hypothetical protein
MPDINQRFILGTEGKPDYLVLAERGGVVLGFKPVVLPLVKVGTLAGIFVGFRLRSAHAQGVTAKPVDGAENVVSFQKKLGLTEAWPAIKFSKVDDARASVVVGNPYEVTGDQLALIPFMDMLTEGNAFAGAWEAIVDWVPNEAWEVTSGELTNYFSDKTRDELKLLIAALAPPASEPAVPADDGGKVYSFQPKSLKKFLDKTKADLPKGLEDTETGEDPPTG